VTAERNVALVTSHERGNIIVAGIKVLLSNLLERTLPAPTRVWLNIRILSRTLGQWKSIKAGRPIDRGGQPIPWYTYPCIEYLRQFDFQSASVFEFGSGNSTRFWTERAATVVSVEDNPEWFCCTEKFKKANQSVYLRSSADSYVSCLEEQKRVFDIIVIDGRWRNACARAAPDHLACDGFILLDNADWHTRAAQNLRERGFFEIDFSGFGPINGYTWTTSIFIKGGTRLQACFTGPHPLGGIGQETDEES